jgi:5-methylcytosine-specific restriction endonuclease McrA
MKNQFIEHVPTKESCWRSIILMGQNVASYKFALAKSLITLANQNKTFIPMDELAKPFSRNLCNHLKISDKQITSKSSKYLDVCNKFNRNEIEESDLIEQTTRLGFVNVIDAFHVVNRDQVPIRFFDDNRKSEKGITLTDDFFKLAQSGQFRNLPNEVEARWRLVETAWKLNISSNLISVEYDKQGQLLYIKRSDFERTNITSSRNALNGYQKGKCFYCFDEISINEKDGDLADVDHFFPHKLKQFKVIKNIDGIWNLVLACKNCNRGQKGKFERIPEINYLERLNTRNNFLISSHHPLKETLLSQTGTNDKERHYFLNSCYSEAINFLMHTWKPKYEYEPAF